MREVATKAYDFVAVKPFSPASDTVGKSGRKGARASPVVASGISLPAVMCCPAVGMVAK